MFCSNCGSQVSDSVKFCPNCGSAIIRPVGRQNTESVRQGVSTEQSSANASWARQMNSHQAYVQQPPKDNNPYTSPSIPSGKKPKKGMNPVLKWILIILGVLIVLGLFGNSDNEKDNEKEREEASILEETTELEPEAEKEEVKVAEEEKSEEASEETKEESEIGIEEESLGESSVDAAQVENPDAEAISSLSEFLGEETASHVVGLLRDTIGFEQIRYDEKKVNNYFFTCDGLEIVATAFPKDEENEEYIRIFTPYNGDVYYDPDEGGLLMTAEQKKARSFTSSEAIKYSVIAEQIVKDSIDSTKVKFPGYNSGVYEFRKNGNLVAVTGNCEAQNAFGVMMKTDWVVQFIPIDLDNYSYETTYIKIGDSSAGAFQNME